jgi:hypothetical protein
MCCSYSDIWSVWFSDTVIITVLKSVAKKCLLKTEDFYVCCSYSDIWRVWFSGTVIIALVAIFKWSIDPISNQKTCREIL